MPTEGQRRLTQTACLPKLDDNDESRSQANTRPGPPVSFAGRLPCRIMSIGSRWYPIALGLMALATVFALCVFPLYDTDFWWHLRTGDLIRATGSIPQGDTFSYTHYGDDWIDLHWGFQVLVSVVYQLAGVTGIILVKAAIYTAAVTIAWLAGRQPGFRLTPPDFAWSIWLWLIPLVGISGRALERPEMLTVLFLAMTLRILAQAERHPHRLWWLPPLFLVWVNCHALFVIGLVVCATWALDLGLRGALAPRWGLRPVDAAVSERTILLVAASVVLALLVNPYFTDGLLFPLTLYRKFSIEQEFYATRIGEFQRPLEFFRRAGFSNIYLNAQLLTGTMTLVALVFAWRRGDRRPWLILLVLAFGNLALEASRNTSLFCLVCGFVLVHCLPATSQPPLVPANNSEKRGQIPLHAQLLAVVLPVWFALIWSGIWNELGEKNKPCELREARVWFMHDAVRFAGQPGMPAIAFAAHIGQASVYMYHLGPDRLVFMDPRLEIMSRQTFERFEQVQQLMATGNPAWEALVRTTTGELPAVLLDSRNSRPAIEGLLQTPGWRIVFADASGALFVRDEVAQRLKLPPADFSPLMRPPPT
jgi:hypothetical protein